MNCKRIGVDTSAVQFEGLFFIYLWCSALKVYIISR